MESATRLRSSRQLRRSGHLPLSRAALKAILFPGPTFLGTGVQARRLFNPSVACSVPHGTGRCEDRCSQNRTSGTMDLLAVGSGLDLSVGPTAATCTGLQEPTISSDLTRLADHIR